MLHLPEGRSDLQRYFPDAIRADVDADWSQWPGDTEIIHESPEKRDTDIGSR